MNKKGHLIIISGPSGVGKGTLCDKVLSKYPDIAKSVSITTRQPRKGEINGRDYYFVTKEQYDEIKNRDGFLETFSIYGNYYGTPSDFVTQKLDSGVNVLLEIDVQGALTVKNKMPEAKLIFIAPPSIEHLKSRLSKRNTEDETSYNIRINAAQAELDNKEKYDYIVVNDDLETAANKICGIIDNIIK